MWHRSMKNLISPAILKINVFLHRFYFNFMKRMKIDFVFIAVFRAKYFINIITCEVLVLPHKKKMKMVVRARDMCLCKEPHYDLKSRLGISRNLRRFLKWPRPLPRPLWSSEKYHSLARG